MCDINKTIEKKQLRRDAFSACITVNNLILIELQMFDNDGTDYITFSLCTSTSVSDKKNGNILEFATRDRAKISPTRRTRLVVTVVNVKRGLKLKTRGGM